MTAAEKKQVDEFAKAAMQAIITNNSVLDVIAQMSDDLYGEVAKEAYDMG
jgi:hypothetical protein